MSVDAPPKLPVKWFSLNQTSERTWGILKAKLTGAKTEYGSYFSEVNLSEKDADKLIENIKKSGEFPSLEDQTGIHNEEYQNWLVDTYLKNPVEEMKADDDVPSNLDDLLSTIRDQPEPKGALTLYEGKRDTDLVDEEIDERILRLIGIEDTFDIDYGTYKTLLREKLTEGRVTGKELPREEDELLVNEFRRIKSKVGRFKIKKKKISFDGSAAKSAIIKVDKLLPSSLIPDKESKSSEDLVEIEKLLDSILKSIRNESKEEKKKATLEKKESENKKRELRESGLEKGFEKAKSIISKVIAPFQSLIDKIQRFLFFTLLGRAFKLFVDWASDPQNKKKLEVIGRFLKDWWPSLLGAWFLFANPLGKFVRSIIGTIAKLTFKLAKFAIPRLLSFAAKNPLVAAGLATGLATFGAEMWRQGEEKKQVQKEATKRNVKPEVVQKEVETAKSSSMGMFGEAFSKLGPMGYANGGRIFSGMVGNNGSKVSGAGPDTQYFPIDGGGGAVLSPGELVLTTEQQAQIEKDTGIHPATYVNGISPRKITGPIMAASKGGIVGYNQGGIIGALGRFLPGTGTVMAPRSSGPKDIRGVRQTIAGYQNKFLGMNVGSPYFPGGSIGEYSQQENRRYYERTGKYFIPTDFGPKYLPGIHGLYTPPNNQRQVRPQGAITSANNQQLRNAIQNARDITNMPGGRAYKPLVERTAETAIKQQKKYDILREAMRNGGMKGADENMNLYGKPLDRQGGGLVPQGPFTPLPSPGYVRPQGSFIPKPMFYLPGPMPGSKLSFGYDPFKGLKGGGLVKENTGMDIPGATADRQFLPPIAVQPGEGHYIIPQGAMQRGAVPMIDRIVAQLDPDSMAKKQGLKIEPPTQSKFITLPPSIIKSESETINRPVPGSQVVPTFSAYRKTNERYESMKIYTLRSSTIGSGVM